MGVELQGYSSSALVTVHGQLQTSGTLLPEKEHLVLRC